MTTVQDLGRAGLADIGVARSGAADRCSLRLGNRLVGNPDDTAGLEMAISGAKVNFEYAAQIVLAGETSAVLTECRGEPRLLASWQPATLAPGASVDIGRISAGMRAYLCIAGGVQTPRVLGARATHCPSGLGGLAGRPLRTGDSLPCGLIDDARQAHIVDVRAIRAFTERWVYRTVIRLVPGPHAGLVSRVFWEQLTTSRWKVSDQADRVGLRLNGPQLPLPTIGNMPSEAMPPGAMQIAGDGRPIVLGVDGPTTGGYPAPACVVRADEAAIGQLALRTEVRFVLVTHAAAREQYALRESEFSALADVCGG
ncbi:MAG: biotin-dependent carboxyltransferase family protein [Phycisphaeraceae bacterium]|nr:biotin-dependent carboxyltransferase family protein [Phycisphaeraceae bacterium]MCW5754379.1 biotin-dependent carboxyltransferase family protein [Phycisphaeraceae bacterium]